MVCKQVYSIMRAFEILNELSLSKPLIVVDIQPQYITSVDGFVGDLAKYINNRNGRQTLMLYNGPELTEDDIDDIKYWWYEEGMNPNIIDSIEWIDKGYGYLRSWMDNGISENVIIKAIREMYKQRVTSSSLLFNGDEDKIKEFIGSEYDDWMIDDEIHIQWMDISALNRYKNCYLCGGGREQCLKEIMILMNAFNIKYTLLQQFIY